MPADVRQLQSRLTDFRGALQAIVDGVRTVAGQLRIRGQDEPHLRAAELLARLATKVVEAPPMDRGALGDPVWENELRAVEELVGQGQELAAQGSRLEGIVAEIAWETEVWVAESPDHLIHFNGERFLGPYGG